MLNSFYSIPIQFKIFQFNSKFYNFNSVQFSSIQFNSVQFSSVQFNSIDCVPNLSIPIAALIPIALINSNSFLDDPSPGYVMFSCDVQGLRHFEGSIQTLDRSLGCVIYVCFVNMAVKWDNVVLDSAVAPLALSVLVRGIALFDRMFFF